MELRRRRIATGSADESESRLVSDEEDRLVSAADEEEDDQKCKWSVGTCRGAASSAQTHTQACARVIEAATVPVEA